MAKKMNWAAEKHMKKLQEEHEYKTMQQYECYKSFLFHKVVLIHERHHVTRKNRYEFISV